MLAVLGFVAVLRAGHRPDPPLPVEAARPGHHHARAAGGGSAGSPPWCWRCSCRSRSPGRRPGSYWLAWPGYLWLALMFYLLVVLVVLEVPMLVTRLVLRRRVVAAEPTTAAPEPVLVGAAGPRRAAGRRRRRGTGPRPVPPAAAGPRGGHLRRPHRRRHHRVRRPHRARPAAARPGADPAGQAPRAAWTACASPPSPTSTSARCAAGRTPSGSSPLINRLDADLVAVVGDLVDGSVAELGAAAAPLRDLRSRYGSFFVTGNHEYYSGVEEWVAGGRPARACGCCSNERQEIQARGGVLDLAGVNDVDRRRHRPRRRPDFAAALGGRDPSRPVVLLAHQPLAAKEAARHGVDLQLSGHTHGGQMVPFNLVVGCSSRWSAGSARSTAPRST